MPFMKYLSLFAVYILSYGIGFLMYRYALWVKWKQVLTGGDLQTVLFWSAFAYIPVGFLYLLLCVLIKYKIRRPLIRNSLYPICCALLFVIPISFILLFNGGGRLSSPEAGLFSLLYVSAGLAFGLGYSLIARVFDKR